MRFVLLNPHYVNKSTEMVDNSLTKNDAKVIANLMKDSKYTKPKLPTRVDENLRMLMNLKEKEMVNLGQLQRQIQNWLDRFFPEYTEAFKDWEGISRYSP